MYLYAGILSPQKIGFTNCKSITDPIMLKTRILGCGTGTFCHSGTGTFCLSGTVIKWNHKSSHRHSINMFN
jgi:hypothetical protein